MIALFFACCENLDQDARIVIKLRSEFNQLRIAVDKLPINKVVLLVPPEDLLRAKDQSGVLIHAPLGFLSVAKEETIVIKAELKREVLEYLSDRYDISHGAISAAELDRLITNQIIERDRDSETYDSEGVLEMFKSQHSSPTQFIYELLQNAEDANAKEVRIKLTKYGLDVHHDGDDFSIEDIKGLVSVGFSSKSDDLNKVGQFGVGFKSVFRFTSTPQVFSGLFNLEIYDGICLSKLETGAEDKELGTLIRLPFNYEESEGYNDFAQEEAFKRVQKELVEDLAPTTLLFLKKIRKIEWETPNPNGGPNLSGGWEKDSTEKKLRIKTPLNIKVFNIKLKPTKNEHNTDVQEYVVFRRKIEINHKELCVEAAFKLGKRKKLRKPTVVAERDKGLIVLFPTKKVTHLNFLIQGPYRTIPSREGVSLDGNEQNKEIVVQTGELVADSLLAIKGCKDIENLYADFLSVLPIDPPNERTKENFIYTTLYDKVKEKLLSGGKSLPISGGGYASPRKSLIATGEASEWLLEHLNKTDIQRLYSKEFWVDTKIATKLRNYLIAEIKVESIAFETFVESMRDYGTANFLGKKQDLWMIDFYSELLGYEPLWKQGRANIRGEYDPFLRYERIIRLNTNTRKHVPPFGRFAKNKKPQVYLPTKGRPGHPTVKEKLYEHKKSREFLVDLGLKEPSLHDHVRDVIIPEYQGGASISRKKWLRDFEEIFKSYRTIRSDEKCDLKELLLNTKFIPSIDNTGAYSYCVPGVAYIPSNELREFFKGCQSVYFVDAEMLKGDKDGKLFLKELGITDGLKCIETIREPTVEESIKIENAYCYPRSRNARREPITDHEYNGLEEFLMGDINLDRSLLLWNLLLKHIENLPEDKVWPETAQCEWDHYNRPYSEQFDAKFLRTLNESPWLVDNDGELRCPSDTEISELPSHYEKKSDRAKILIEGLGFVEKKLSETIETEDSETSLGETIDRKMEELREAGFSEEEIRKVEEKAREELNRLVAEARGDSQVQEMTPTYECDPSEVNSEEEDFKPPETTTRRRQSRQGGRTSGNSRVRENNDSEEPQHIGGWGEKRVYLHLMGKLSKKGEITETTEGFKLTKPDGEVINVIWPGKIGKTSVGYDICVESNKEGVKYIEVKSSKEVAPLTVDVTGAQWELAEDEGEKYFVYVVKSADTPNSRIMSIDDPAGRWRRGELQIDLVRIKLPKNTQDD